MRKLGYLLLLIISLSFIGCENYKYHLETEIDGKIHLIGNGPEAKVIIEYNLGPFYIVDSIPYLDEVDIFYFSKLPKECKFEIVSEKTNWKLSADGIYYIYNGAKYKGSKFISVEDAWNNRKSLPGLYWKMIDGIEKNEGFFTEEEIQNIISKRKIGDTPEEEPKEVTTPKTTSIENKGKKL